MKFRPLSLALAGTALLGLASVLPTTVAGATECSLTGTGGTVNRSLGSRSYRLNVPAGLTGTQVPLLMSLHGGGQTASTHESETQWNGYAASHNFIVAYPQAVSNKWALDQGSADVTFLRSVVDDIAATWCLDASHINVEGYSDGGVMADRLACDAGDKFAAIVNFGSAAATYTGTPCEPSRPVAEGWYFGQADPVFYTGQGAVGRDFWVDFNNCSPTPIHTTDSLGTLDRYTGCDAGTEVQWRIYNMPQSHNWPSGATATDIRNRMWTFLQAHPLP